MSLLINVIFDYNLELNRELFKIYAIITSQKVMKIFYFNRVLMFGFQ